jgi:hypothetical protein
VWVDHAISISEILSVVRLLQLYPINVATLSIMVVSMLCDLAKRSTRSRKTGRKEECMCNPHHIRKVIVITINCSS